MLYTETFFEGFEVGKMPAGLVRIELCAMYKKSESYMHLVFTAYIYCR